MYSSSFALSWNIGLAPLFSLSSSELSTNIEHAINVNVLC
jgi:hypothetical protein